MLPSTDKSIKPSGGRFRKGGSGNPKGRPKGSPNRKKLFTQLMQEQIETPEGERVPVVRALVRKILSEAEAGNLAACDILKSLQDHIEPVSAPDQKRGSLIVPKVARDMEEWSRLYGPDASGLWHREGK
jgi:hypothetical protein